jgi:hypothetical protein
MHRQTLQLTQKILGKNHPDTLGSLNNLANSLYHQGKYGEAEMIHRQAFQLMEIVLGKDHPHTLVSMDNLALSRQAGHPLLEENTDQNIVSSPQASAPLRTCPLCGEFEGDEAAVSHHFNTHFD